MKLNKTRTIYESTWMTISEHNIKLEEIYSFREKLSNNHNITISRFNDGEWIFMLKIEPYFSQKRKKYPSQEILHSSERLLEIINNQPEYNISIDTFSLNDRKISKKIQPYLPKIKNRIGSGIFNIWSINTSFTDLFSIFDVRKTIVVGPEFLSNLPFNIQKHILTDLKESVNFPDRTIEELLKYLGDNFEENMIILYSCSFTAKLCIDNLYKKYGNKITQLDMGASLAPFAGVSIRPWHDVMIQEINEMKI